MGEMTAVQPTQSGWGRKLAWALILGLVVPGALFIGAVMVGMAVLAVLEMAGLYVFMGPWAYIVPMGIAVLVYAAIIYRVVRRA